MMVFYSFYFHTTFTLQAFAFLCLLPMECCPPCLLEKGQRGEHPGVMWTHLLWLLLLACWGNWNSNNVDINQVVVLGPSLSWALGVFHCCHLRQCCPWIFTIAQLILYKDSVFFFPFCTLFSFYLISVCCNDCSIAERWFTQSLHKKGHFSFLGMPW